MILLMAKYFLLMLLPMKTCNIKKARLMNIIMGGKHGLMTRKENPGHLLLEQILKLVEHLRLSDLKVSKRREHQKACGDMILQAIHGLLQAGLRFILLQICAIGLLKEDIMVLEANFIALQEIML